MTALPAPGVHPGIGFEEYLGWDALSNSALGDFAECPAKYLWKRANPEPETDAMRLGSAAHCLVFEGLKEYLSRHAFGPCNDRRTKKWTEWATPLENSFDLLTPEQDGVATHIAHTVWNDPSLLRVLTSCPDRELSLLWTDPATGVLCKCRFDAYGREFCGGTVADLKTCQDASPIAFRWTMQKYGYDRKAAWYLRGAAACGLPAEHFMYFAVESKPPHLAAGYRMTDRSLMAQHRATDKLLARFAECQKSGVWPGYTEHGIIDLEPSEWRLRELEKEDTE